VGLIDNLGNSIRGSGQSFDSSTLQGMGLDINELLTNLGAVQQHCDEKKKSNNEAIAATADQKSEDSMGSVLNNAVVGAAKLIVVNSVSDAATGGYLAQKAQTEISNLINKGIDSKDSFLKGITDINPSDLLSKAFASFDPQKSASEAFNVAKNLLTMTVQQIGEDAVLVTVQKIAKQIVTQVNDRKVVLDDMEKNINLMYNQLYTVINGKDAIAPYLIGLRQALAIIVAQEFNLRKIRNSVARTGVLNNRSYDTVIAKLNSAQALLMPQGEAGKTYTFVQDAVSANLPSPLKDALKAIDVSKSCAE
jgi:hypothetical protein